MVLDIFSKYGWIVPLKNKSGVAVTDAFSEIFKEGRKPKYLWIDRGKEFYNKNLQDLFKKYNIELYSTENEEKSSVCWRWNRTIKTKMYKQFTINKNTVYVDILPKILAKYNNTRHSSIKMIPPKSPPKFSVNDIVRRTKYIRKTFDQSYTPDWTKEVFIIDKTQYKDPITYKIRDQNDEEIKGSFYETRQIQKTDQNIYRIEKVIKRLQPRH